MYGMAMSATVAQAVPDERAAFIRRTYGHLAGAVGAFVVLEYLLITSPIAEPILRFAFGTSFGWLGVLGAFMVCGWLARSLAANVASVPLQYAGLALKRAPHLNDVIISAVEASKSETAILVSVALPCIIVGAIVLTAVLYEYANLVGPGTFFIGGAGGLILGSIVGVIISSLLRAIVVPGSTRLQNKLRVTSIWQKSVSIAHECLQKK